MSSDAGDPASGGLAPTVTVRGEAVLRGEPDEAMLWVTLTALEDGPGSALTNVAGRSEALGALLDELGVASADRSTTGVRVYEEFDHTHEGRRSLGHRAVAAVSMRLTDTDVIGRVASRATSELGARIDGPRWQIAPDNPLRLEAARAAAADGKRKAAAYAEGVGARLGALVRLAEPEHPIAMRLASARHLDAAELPIESGEQEITAAIDVTFALEPA